MGRYKALFEEGLIASEVYRDLTGRLEDAQRAEAPPRFDIGLDTERLIARLDLFATLDRLRAPCEGGAFQWVQVPPGDRSSREQPEQSSRQRDG